MNPASGLTELEERLASKEAASLRAELEAQLKVIEGRLRQRILDGLSREDYLDHQAALQAVQAASEIIAEYHNVNVSLPNVLSPSPLSTQFPR